MALRNVMLITHQFPPIGGSGVQRAVKLARYLPRAGWRAHILCAAHGRHPLADATLHREVGEHARVHRAGGLEPSAVSAVICRHLRRHDRATARLRALEDRIYWRVERFWKRLPMPEVELLWIPSAIRQARRLIDRLHIEAVITTSPPHSIQLIGPALKRRLGIPWIADLRDPILDNFAYAPRSRAADRFWHWLEPTILHRADHVVVTCPELVDRLRLRYARLAPGRFSTVTNGFDPADAPTPSNTRPATRFTLTYVGAFYRDQTIGPVLEALRRLRQARSDIAQWLDFRLVGSLAASLKPLLREQDAAFFHHVGYRPHRVAVAEMARASALLLTTPANEGGRLCIPAKTFEYLAFGKHMIAVVHEGTALADILADAGNTSIVHDRQPAALARAIERCFDAWQAGVLNRPRNPDVVQRFRRDRLAARYARIIEHCADGRPLLRLSTDGLTTEEAA